MKVNLVACQTIDVFVVCVCVGSCAQKEKAAVRFHEKVTNKALNIKPPLADVSLEDLAKARSVYGVRRPLTTVSSL